MTHVDSLVTDYVLDLLPDDQRRAVERHAAGCPRCLELLAAARRREARLAGAFRGTMAPPAGRLEALWPQVSLALDGGANRSAGWLPLGWTDQWRVALVALGVALVIVLGAFGTTHGLDSWLLSTYTPTLAATPTASLTPALSHTPISWTETSAGMPRAVSATPAPAPETGAPSPVPLPAPSTLTYYDH
jgi:anti-sigma factor RsiW